METAVAVGFFAWGAVGYAFYPAFGRLPAGLRIRIYVWFAAMALVVLGAFGLTRLLQWPQVLIGFGAFLFGQTFAFGTQVWVLQADLLGDPKWRDEQGLPQYEGRSRRYWELRILVSPWHIVKYHRYAWSDPDSPARKHREQRRPS